MKKSIVGCEISSNTVLIRNKGEREAEILYYNNSITVPYSSKKIIDNNCKLFGSSLNGRIESSKEWLGYDYKLPIIIDEIRNLVLFPTRSIDSPKNIWLSFNAIDDYNSYKDGIELTLKNGKKVFIKESFNVFESQYIRASKLHKRIEKIKATII